MSLSAKDNVNLDVIMNNLHLRQSDSLSNGDPSPASPLVICFDGDCAGTGDALAVQGYDDWTMIAHGSANN